MLLILAPPTWIKEPENTEAVEGEIVIVTCSASGYPTPSIVFKKEGKF